MTTPWRLLQHTVAIALCVSVCSQTAGCSAESPLKVEEGETLTDIDGHRYRTIEIGGKVWMMENLTVAHFRNGDPIPEARTTEEWLQAGAQRQPAWCFYGNDPDQGRAYGRLYNWHAVNDPRGLAPNGWRVPDNREWAALIGNLGGDRLAGMRMKSSTGWSAGGNGDDTGGFAALPGGGRAFTGDFSDVGTAALFWSALEQTAIRAWGYNLNGTNGFVLQGSFEKVTGLSVRALRCTSCATDTASASTLGESLQVALDLSLRKSRGVGVSAAVILPDGESWVGVSGVSHGQTTLAPDMPFSAGSIEKMFAAATVLQLVEEGRLTLEDPLSQWLPPYPHVDGSITIRQLLNHTSGLPNFVSNPEYWATMFGEPSRPWTLEEVLLAFSRDAVFAPGTGWRYSQTGYNLVRMVIREVTGAEIPMVNRDRFFAPLGLATTFTSVGEAPPVDIAHGWYDLDGDLEYEDLSSWPRTAFASGIGGEVWSTPQDLARWARALFHDKRVVSGNALEQMLTFHAPCPGEEFFVAGYGLGVARLNPGLFGGLEVYGHGGHGPGYSAACLYLPAFGVCVGLMDNTDGGEAIGTSLSRLTEVVAHHFEDGR